MGFRPTFYAVDPKKVEAVWECHDVDLLRQLKESVPPESELFAPDSSTSDPSLREALEELVAGRLRDNASQFAHRYQYAVEHICRNFGEVLEERDNYIGPGEHDWDTRLDQFRSLPSLPPTSGIPHVSYLTMDEIVEEHSALKKTLDDPSLLAEYEQEEDALRDFESIMQECLDRGQGLYLFYY